MTLSDLSVRRPVLAAVAAIILCVIGLAAFSSLAIRELPNVDPPQVSITTTYVGASAEVVEERITQVIEQQVSGMSGGNLLVADLAPKRWEFEVTLITMESDVARGIQALDAPMSGGPARALDGTMSLMVACDDAV